MAAKLDIMQRTRFIMIFHAGELYYLNLSYQKSYTTATQNISAVDWS